MMQRAISFFQKENSIQVWGPIFLLLTVGIAARTAVPLDFLCLAMSGFLLCAIWEKKGCLYALILLGFWAAVKHSLLDSGHLWQFGLEGSLACALFLTAVAFEQNSQETESMQTQIQTRQAAVQNLEEEMAKVQETSLAQQMGVQEKLSALQKELDELQTEHSSILILNDVLRKTSARQLEENDYLVNVAQDRQARIDVLQAELGECQNELLQLRQTDLVMENGRLMKELNAARYDKEQTHLINETLARLHASESLKAKEAIEEIGSLEDLLFKSQSEGKILVAHVDQLSGELENARKVADELKEVQVERAFLRDRLQNAEEEISTLSRPLPEANNDHLFEQIAQAKEQVASMEKQLNDMHLEKNFFQQQFEEAKVEIDKLQERPAADHSEELTRLAQIEPLFKQLKKQFEEKNQVLNQTRTELFKTDTELQKLRMEKSALELNPFPKEVEEDIRALSQQIGELEEENQHLHDLISLLSQDSPPTQKKN